MRDLLTVDRPRTEPDAPVEEQLAAFLRERSDQAARYGADFARLWDAAADCLLGGKMLRPRLLLDVFDALAPRPDGTPGSETRAAAIRLAAAVELLHYSFLLHDDVIDGDLMRRHRPNLIGLILQDVHPGHAGARAADDREDLAAGLHWARSGAILMGDLMLSAAHRAFARESLPEGTRLRLLDALDHTITESVAGEQLDIGLGVGTIAADLDTVLSMSRWKTASYTFELPMRAGAILAGAPRELEAFLGEAGRHLGLAFQLQDDLLSVFGAAAEHGKDAYSDLREGKETAIIAYARMTSVWPRIEPIIGSTDFCEQDGQAIRALLSECGAEQFARSLVEEQLAACGELLGDPARAMPEPLTRLISDLIGTLKGRSA
ncbi:MAG: polyprenyl synthetase family protein [Leucobacter sp.]